MKFKSQIYDALRSNAKTMDAYISNLTADVGRSTEINQLADENGY